MEWDGANLFHCQLSLTYCSQPFVGQCPLSHVLECRHLFLWYWLFSVRFEHEVMPSRWNVEWCGTNMLCCHMPWFDCIYTPLSVSVSAYTFIANGVATYSCLTGYLMSGSNTRACQADGTWSGTAPTCAIITCPAFVSLATTNPLVVSAAGTNIGDVTTYSCAFGFEMHGTSTITCQNDGTWSGSVPTCTPITCPTMSAPIKGQVSFPSGFGVGGEALFGCNPGYILSDNRTATCTVAGTWDISRPSCLYNGMSLLLYGYALRIVQQMLLNFLIYSNTMNCDFICFAPFSKYGS